MNEYYLTLLEVSGIQEYVFGSNELVQNLAASERVSQVTGSWVVETLDDETITHNAKRNGDRYALDPDTGQYELSDQGVENGRAATIIYLGGGKALLLFHDAADKDRFVKRLTRRVLLEAEDLQLVVVND